MLVVFFTVLGLFVIGWLLIKAFNSSVESHFKDNPSEVEQDEDVKQPPKPKQPR